MCISLFEKFNIKLYGALTGKVTFLKDVIKPRSNPGFDPSKENVFLLQINGKTENENTESQMANNYPLICDQMLLRLRHRRHQCDQIGQFIGLWANFQSFWRQSICPNLPHS